MAAVWMVMLVLLAGGLRCEGQRVCPGGCVCIPGVISSCGTTTTEIYWQDFLPATSSAVMNVLPGSFLEGEHVTLLDLSNNPTLTLHNDSFIGLPNLVTLDLSHSGLSHLPDNLFTPLTSLEHLDLSFNDLTSVNPVAFEGVTSLQTLMLQFNRLSMFPPPSLLPLLGQLNTTISLIPNPIDCSSADVIPLLQLLGLEVIVNGNLLRCSNGTLVMALNYELPTPAVTMATSTAIMMTSNLVTPTPTTSAHSATPTVTMSALTPSTTPTSSTTPTPSTTLTPSTTPTPSTTLTPSTTPTPPHCVEESTTTIVGVLNWPRTYAVAMAMLQCPTGVGVVYRLCGREGVWGVVNDSLCLRDLPITDLLNSVSKLPITAQSSERLSYQLALSVTFDLRLTSQELDTLTSIATALVGVASGNVQVLNNTLSVVSSVLQSSPDQLSPPTTRRVRSLIDRALLGALSLNHTHLVLSYAGLAVGGAYIPASNQSTLLAFVRIQSNSSVGIVIGGEEGSSDVTVAIDGGEGGVQVTVYDGDNLFNQSNCSNATAEVGGHVLTPVITVTNEGAGTDEVITISYSHVATPQGHTHLCVRWVPFDCGGGVWSQTDCALVTSTTGQLQCRCLHAGSYAVLDVTDTEPTNGDGVGVVSTTVFHVLVSLPLPLYLTIIITILASRSLRPLPSYQGVLFLSLSQGCSLLVLQLPFSCPAPLCYTVATLTHYTILVTLSWLVALPVLEAIKVFKIIWYEKSWLIAPFAIVTWVWPAIPVGVYAGLRYSQFPQSPDLCWLEAVTFPNALTYISAFTGMVVMVTTLVTLVMLACSDYTLQASTYLHLVSHLMTFALYGGMVVCLFFTGSAHQFGLSRDHMTIVTGGVACLCGLYFFLSEYVAQSKVRGALTCRQGRGERRKKQLSQRGVDSGFHSRSSPGGVGRTRRPTITLTDELNINYVDEYLGYPHGGGAVPLAMLGAVRDGSRVNPLRTDVPVLNFTNPLYSRSLASQR